MIARQFLWSLTGVTVVGGMAWAWQTGSFGLACLTLLVTGIVACVASEAR